MTFVVDEQRLRSASVCFSHSDFKRLRATVIRQRHRPILASQNEMADPATAACLVEERGASHRVGGPSSGEVEVGAEADALPHKRFSSPSSAGSEVAGHPAARRPRPVRVW